MTNLQNFPHTHTLQYHSPSVFLFVLLLAFLPLGKELKSLIAQGANEIFRLLVMWYGRSLPLTKLLWLLMTVYREWLALTIIALPLCSVFLSATVTRGSSFILTIAPAGLTSLSKPSLVRFHGSTTPSHNCIEQNIGSFLVKHA